MGKSLPSPACVFPLPRLPERPSLTCLLPSEPSARFSLPVDSKFLSPVTPWALASPGYNFKRSWVPSGKGLGLSPPHPLVSSHKYPLCAAPRGPRESGCWPVIRNFSPFPSREEEGRVWASHFACHELFRRWEVVLKGLLCWPDISDPARSSNPPALPLSLVQTQRLNNLHARLIHQIPLGRCVLQLSRATRTYPRTQC